jgi:hypothetical protein
MYHAVEYLVSDDPLVGVLHWELVPPFGADRRMSCRRERSKRLYRMAATHVRQRPPECPDRLEQRVKMRIQIVRMDWTLLSAVGGRNAKSDGVPCRGQRNPPLPALPGEAAGERFTFSDRGR